MSKFWFFDRKGRPTNNEKRICDKLNSLINEGRVSANQIEEYIEDYSTPMNESELDEMYGYLLGEYSDGKKYTYADDDSNDVDDYSDEIMEVDFEDDDYETSNNGVNQSDLGGQDPIDFNPFAEPVIERNYTKGFQPKEGIDDDSDSEEGEEDEDVKFNDDDLKMPKDGEGINDEEDEDIPEPEWANTGGVHSDLEDDEDEDDEDYDDEDDDGREKLGGDNLQDLTPAQKRKAAEKTAEALLNMYCQFVPMPFKKWSSFSDAKIQKMVFENKIDLSMQLENNVSVKDYIDGTNEQVEEVFKVSDETREEIKDPLIDVLLEQDLALTPTQRLMLAVGGHLVTMGFSAFQLAQNNKQALETFEKFHIQMNKQNAPPYQQQPNVKRQPRQREDNLSKVEKESVEEMMKMMDDDYDTTDEEIIDAQHDPSVEISEDYGDDD